MRTIVKSKFISGKIVVNVVFFNEWMAIHFADGDSIVFYAANYNDDNNRIEEIEVSSIERNLSNSYYILNGLEIMPDEEYKEWKDKTIAQDIKAAKEKRRKEFERLKQEFEPIS